jgi:hypothetical protein
MMAMWLHISAKNKTNVLQAGLHADSQDGAGFTKHGWQSEPHSPHTNVMCKRWDTLGKTLRFKGHASHYLNPARFACSYLT